MSVGSLESGFGLTEVFVATDVVVFGHLGGFVQLLVGKGDRVEVFGKDLHDHRIGVDAIFSGSFAGSGDSLWAGFAGQI